MKRILTMATVAALLAVFSAGAALAESDPAIRGTNAGEGLYGSRYNDLIYGYGGADLIYGYAGRDTIFGGSERGWGDKILGGGSSDKILGQAGDDALYGQRGNDKINGGRGHDVISGGPGRDILNGGPSTDRINAQDGRTDVIIVCRNERDKIFYDRGIDILRYCEGSYKASKTVSSEAPSSSSPNLTTQPAPVSLFGNSGKVLVEHGSSEQCISSKDLKAHAKHGDEIINPAGCSGS
ncbi:hypothetical protein BH24ACT22_BH24ACT22_09530 [soil metagenome]